MVYLSNVVGHGIIFGLICAGVIYLISDSVFDTSTNSRQLLIALACITASCACGLFVGSRPFLVITSLVSLCAVVTMSGGAFASFMNIRLPAWVPLVLVLPTFIAGFQSGSIVMLRDGLFVGLPLGITALFLRKSKMMRSEALTSAAMGAYFGSGYGFLIVAVGILVSRFLTRGREDTKTIPPILGCMYASGLIVFVFSSFVFG